MANLKLNNVVVVTESAGAATVRSGIFKAKDGTAAFTVADSTGAVALSSTLAVTGAATLSTLTTTGSILPSADDAVDLGSPSKQWRNIYTGDLHLKNERGSWTVIEEENYLTLRNNKTDKVYKLVMEEIE
jgi:hypothetical protein